MNRRGSGLLELLIALTVSSMIAVLAWSILATAALRLRERSERMSLTHALRVSMGALRAVVEPLGVDSTGGPDLAWSSPDGLAARVIRASGTVCQAVPDRLVVRAGADWWSALRVPVAGRDTLLVGTMEDSSRWVAAALAGNPIAGACPDGSEGLALPITPGVLGGAALGPGSPLRVVEQVELRRYSSGGNGWLGSRLIATGEAIQPLAGPFPGGGFALSFERQDGAAAGVAAEAVTVVGTVKATSERAGGVGVARWVSGVADSARVSISLRNAQ